MKAGVSKRRSVAPIAIALALIAAASWLAADPEARLRWARDGAMALAVEAVGPALSAWLSASAEAARREGVVPMPSGIRAALAGFVDADVLERVRYRIGGGGVASMQAIAFLHPNTRAITLDGVIVFRDDENAAKPRYWVHEITHLEQIRRWGVDGFARRYVGDAGAVESEAWAMTDRYLAWALRRELNASADQAPPSSRRGG